MWLDLKGPGNPKDNLTLNDRKQKDKQDYHICWNQKYLGKLIFRKMFKSIAIF